MERLQGDQISLLDFAPIVIGEHPGTHIGEGGIAPWDEPKTAPNSVDDSVRCGGENGEVTELGAVNSTAPNSDWIPCKSLAPGWLGAVQRKTIKGRPYWYWRQAKGKSWSSVYLSADWSKAIAKLAKLQLNLSNPTDRQ